MTRVRRGLGLCATMLAVVLPAGAHASELIGRNATAVRLQLAQGRALVSFRTDGQSKRLLAWGAVDARPPSQSVAHVAFELSYGGSLGADTCRPYDGPPLAWLVKACTASDGSHWALQSCSGCSPTTG